MQMNTRALASLILTIVLVTGCIEITLVEKEPGDRLIEFAIVTHTPSQELSAAPTPGSSNSPAPTSTPTSTFPTSDTPTSTSTATATSIPTPSNASTATLTPTPSTIPTATHTPTPWKPNATSTPHWFPSPVLIEPSDGTRYVGRDDNIRLSWQSVGQLEDDVFYVVSIAHPWGVEHGWTKQTSWQVPSYMYDLAPPSRELIWRVRVESFSGTGTPTADQGGVAASEYTKTRFFLWDTTLFDSPIPPPWPTVQPTKNSG